MGWYCLLIGLILNVRIFTVSVIFHSFIVKCSVLNYKLNLCVKECGKILKNKT